MARRWFGGTANDLVVRRFSFGQGTMLTALAPNARVTVWDAETAGARLTDLLVDGVAAPEVYSNEVGYLPRFQGPDEVLTLWADTGDGSPRRLMLTTDGAIDLSTQLASKLDLAEKGAADGVAPLDAGGLVPEAHLPSSVGQVVLPLPTGVAAVDNSALADAITTANASATKKTIVARSSTTAYAINSRHVIPDGVVLVGQGGGSTSRAGSTIFKCMSAGAAIAIYGGGGKSGGFEIDGNSTANTPFERQGGLGANARTFENITVHDNTGDADLAMFIGAQNDLWIQCGFAEASRDLGYFDQGYGGATFLRCEWRTAARYHHRYDNLIASPTYQVPTDIHHIGGIFEGGAGTSVVLYNAAANITYSDHAYYCATAPSGPMVDVVSGFGLEMHNPWFQCTTATVAGTVGLMVRGTANMTVSGRAHFDHLDKAVQVDGLGAYVYSKCNWLFTNVTTNFSGINSGTVAQITDLALGGRTAVGASTDFAEICQPLARDRFLWSRTYAGILSWYPNTAGNFTPDVQLLRRAVGCVGVVNGTQQMLATGAGTTAQRPAAAVALKGALYANTDTGKVEWCDGTTWKNTSDSAWTNPAVTNVGSNPQNAAYDAIGYQKDSNGDVIMRGVVGTVTLNATLWTFPAGYRPLKTKVIDVVTMNGSGVAAPGIATIDSAGVVKVTNGSATLVSFDGKRFRAEA